MQNGTIKQTGKDKNHAHHWQHLCSQWQNVESTQIPSNDEWGNKVWSFHPMEYYAATKRDEALTHSHHVDKPWKQDAKCKSRTQKATDCMTPSVRYIQNRWIHKDRKQSGGCQGYGVFEESGEWQRMGTGFLFGAVELSWNSDRGGDCTTSWMY